MWSGKKSGETIASQGEVHQHNKKGNHGKAHSLSGTKLCLPPGKRATPLTLVRRYPTSNPTYVGGIPRDMRASSGSHPQTGMAGAVLTASDAAVTLGYPFPNKRMPTAWFLKNLIATFLLPPGNGLLLLALALFFRKRRWGFVLALLGGLLLGVQSLPPVASWLSASLEDRAGPVIVDAGGAQAIVVLGSGLNRGAAEYGGDTVNERSLVRLRYGATLARRFGLPILVSGGTPPRAYRAEGDAIAEVLEKEFAVPVRWRETRSMDTADNADMSAAILHAAGIRRVILVTQAFHMPRAQRLFNQAGLEVVPAPTDFRGRRGQPIGPLEWLPDAAALHRSYHALHEWLGIAWIELRQRV